MKRSNNQDKCKKEKWKKEILVRGPGPKEKSLYLKAKVKNNAPYIKIMSQITKILFKKVLTLIIKINNG